MQTFYLYYYFYEPIGAMNHYALMSIEDMHSEPLCTDVK